VYSKEAGLDHVQGFDSLPQLLPAGRVMVYGAKNSKTMTMSPYWCPYQIMACYCSDMLHPTTSFLPPDTHQQVRPGGGAGSHCSEQS
jgi:hypothetical protein